MQHGCHRRLTAWAPFAQIHLSLSHMLSTSQVRVLTDIRVCKKLWGRQPLTLYNSHMPHEQFPFPPTKTLFEALYMMCITGMQRM